MDGKYELARVPIDGEILRSLAPPAPQ